MEGSLDELKLSYLDRLRVLKDRLMERFRAGKRIEKLEQEDNLLVDLLPCSTLRVISLHNCESDARHYCSLDEYLPGFGHSIAIFNRFILLVGGSSHFGEALDSVYEVAFGYDENDWFRIEGVEKEKFRLRVRRKFCSCLVYNGKVFVFGGENEEACSSFEVIDVENPGRENKLFDMTKRKGFINANLFKGCAYVVSSETHFIEVIDLNTFERYRCLETLLFTGYCFIYVSDEYNYLVSSSGKLITIDKSWKKYNHEDLNYELTWVQTHREIKGKICLQDFFSGAYRKIKLI